ncbi:MAG: hypothetical protein DRH21_03255 [Deltaproteobacteria bacterium]|nr:MAG: hypothetical protein DRH21_03255 [Deltaproteobacteria bacterium]
MSKERDKFELEERLIEFAVRVIQTAGSLPKTKTGNHISGQLILSGTSPAPNYDEAQSAESRAALLRLAIACYSAPSRLALDAHCSPKKTQFASFRNMVYINFL